MYGILPARLANLNLYLTRSTYQILSNVCTNSLVVYFFVQVCTNQSINDDFVTTEGTDEQYKNTHICKNLDQFNSITVFIYATDNSWLILPNANMHENPSRQNSSNAR